MTTAEKIIENASLQAISRISMILTPILFTIAGGIFWLYLDGIAADASAAVDTSSSLSTRVTVLEDNQTRGREDRIRYQDQVIDTLADVNRSLIEQGKQIATLTATIDALKQRGVQ
jgi:uncharacterized coiled-coil protein SlyX